MSHPILNDRRVGGALLALLCVSRALFAAEPAAPDSEIVPLAPLVAGERAAPTPLRATTNWLHGRIGEFEVLSSVGARETVEFAKRFHEAHQLFGDLFPTVNVAKRRPLTLVLCGTHATFRELQPADSSAARERGVEPTTFLLGDDNLAVLGIDLSARGPAVASRDAAGGARNSSPLGPSSQVKREYVRFVLSQGEGRVPAWLEEGVAQLFALTETVEGKLRFGPLSPELVAQLESVPGEGELARLDRRDGLEALAVFFQRRGFMPLDEFFARSAYADDPRDLSRGTFALQSLAFVHYCLYAKDGAQQMAFTNFVTRLGREPATEAMFTACFGKNHRAFLAELRAHVQESRYGEVAAREYQPAPMPEPVLRAAKPVEWLRVTGDAQRLGGRLDDAARTLQLALENNHTDGRLYAAIGALQSQRNQPDEALLAFRNAATAKVDLPGPYLALARYRLRASSQDEADGMLTRREFVSAMRFIMAAHAQMRAPRRDVYQTAAAAWIRSPVSPLNENLEILEEGVQAFPSDTWLVADTAELKRRIGRIEDAHRLAQLGLRVARDEAVRSRFVNLANETKPGK